jgi:two-component system phosphate regulon sensor histidine kinase PhoR
MIGVLQDVTEQKLVEEELRLYRNQLEHLVNERTAELEAITLQLRHEIAERQEAQEALLAQKQHTEMVLNHVADGVISTDVQGNILYVNPAWEQLTGYTSDEVRGRNPRFLQSGYTKRSNYKEMWETILAGDVWTGLFINQRKDRTNFDTLETIVPVKNIQGDITHFVSVWRDVTKEQRLAAMKEEFIANAAHDLSNPITVLHTTLYLLKRDPTQLKQRLTLFEDQIAMLQTLVDDLLTVSRLDRRLMPPTFKRVDLNALITRVLEPQVILAAHKGLTLVCTNSLTEPLFIYGDSDLLTRVFVNLIANAVNYTPYDGHITIATRQEGACAMFIVEDTGIGISVNDIPHIFDRFYRSDSARKTGQGTGLGLAIVKEIVELHQGKIEVESVPQAGTTFRVFLPIETHQVG